MQRVRLQLTEARRNRVVGPDGRAVDVIEGRLLAHLMLGEQLEVWGIVDTGAPRTVIPTRLSKQLAEKGSVAHPTTPQFRGRPGERGRHAVAGRVYWFVDGWVQMTPLDDFDPSLRLAPTWVYARLLETEVERDAAGGWVPRADECGLQEVLLGLNAGVLDGRYLLLSPHPEPARRVADLRDDSPPGPATASPARTPAASDPSPSGPRTPPAASPG